MRVNLRSGIGFSWLGLGSCSVARWGTEGADNDALGFGRFSLDGGGAGGGDVEWEFVPGRGGVPRGVATRPRAAGEMQQLTTGQRGSSCDCRDSGGDRSLSPIIGPTADLMAPVLSPS